MLSNEELLNINGGNAYLENRFPNISLIIRTIHIVYLMRKLFID